MRVHARSGELNAARKAIAKMREPGFDRQGQIDIRQGRLQRGQQPSVENPDCPHRNRQPEDQAENRIVKMHQPIAKAFHRDGPQNHDRHPAQAVRHQHLPDAPAKRSEFRFKKVAGHGKRSYQCEGSTAYSRLRTLSFPHVGKLMRDGS